MDAPTSGSAASGSVAPVPGHVVFLLSAALLAFEVVLLRLFAIETFSHLTYMAVGLALLGFAASGTLLVLLRRAVARFERALFEVLVVLAPFMILAAPLLAQLSGYDPTQLLWDPRQWLSLWWVYGTLALPFLAGGGAIALALRLRKARVGGIYAWNMAGSGAGSFLAIPLLAVLRPDAALAATAVPAALAAALVLSARWRTVLGTVAASIVVAVAVLATWAPQRTLTVTDFKALPQAQMVPEAVRVAEAWDATGWTVAVRAPALRHAPGLSLAYRGSLPSQVALFLDGENAGAVSVGADTADESGFLDWLPGSASYAAGPGESVLVLGSGGGLDVLAALTHGVRRVTAVELVRPMVELARELAPSGAGVYSDPRVRVVGGDARSFAARTGDRFDRVILPPAGVFNATASGILSAGEDFLNTTDAYRTYLRTLAPGGILSVTRWVRTPPRDNVKVILTAADALRAMGVTDVGRSLVFLRSWATGTLLIKPDGFTDGEIARLRGFARERYLDVDWPPALPPGPTFNVIDEPVFAEAARTAAAGGDAMRDFVASFPFDGTACWQDSGLLLRHRPRLPLRRDRRHPEAGPRPGTPGVCHGGRAVCHPGLLRPG
jgi:hypothetical protein